MSKSLRAAKRHDTALDDREIGPAERRLIDRLAEYGVLPVGRVSVARRAARPAAIGRKRPAAP